MLKKWLISIIVNTVALLAVAELFEQFHIDGVSTAIIASIILGILNAIVKPILVVFTLPITVVSLGLFLFVINAITLMLTQWILADAFVIDGFGTAILAAIIIAILNTLLQNLLKHIFD
ncbi:phage holin family protein [Tenuibacillus multivorans]|uniref:Putative membrane protein n=1 Tax=Tenuibacillus multivorans TaxID=237069 RepID=A0A1H0DJK2_9BACI|nr:phage holin family protein [Tenuibacillus multivorans]GEL76527.1 putative membrane protein YvlD [Tenuibacillus multivorans]SDN70239.1 putative membrane protein [Tenuibacillus multivorans]